MHLEYHLTFEKYLRFNDFDDIKKDIDKIEGLKQVYFVPIKSNENVVDSVFYIPAGKSPDFLTNVGLTQINSAIIGLCQIKNNLSLIFDVKNYQPILTKFDVVSKIMKPLFPEAKILYFLFTRASDDNKICGSNFDLRESRENLYYVFTDLKSLKKHVFLEN